MAVGVKRVRVKFNADTLRRKAAAASITSLSAAGAYIRGIAMRSIKVSKDSAAPGHQPHTRKGRLKRGIVFGVQKELQNVLIGPSASAVGTIGRTHEFGGTEPPKITKRRLANWKLAVGGHGPIRVADGKPIVVRLYTAHQVDRATEVVASLPPQLGGPPSKKARKYPARPFMGPALEVSKARLPKFWANAIKGG